MNSEILSTELLSTELLQDLIQEENNPFSGFRITENESLILNHNLTMLQSDENSPRNQIMNRDPTPCVDSKNKDLRHDFTYHDTLSTENS
jgi:hypothetical protein